MCQSFRGTGTTHGVKRRPAVLRESLDETLEDARKTIDADPAGDLLLLGEETQVHAATAGETKCEDPCGRRKVRSVHAGSTDGKSGLEIRDSPER